MRILLLLFLLALAQDTLAQRDLLLAAVDRYRSSNQGLQQEAIYDLATITKKYIKPGVRYETISHEEIVVIRSGSYTSYASGGLLVVKDDMYKLSINHQTKTILLAPAARVKQQMYDQSLNLLSNAIWEQLAESEIVSVGDSVIDNRTVAVFLITNNHDRQITVQSKYYIDRKDSTLIASSLVHSRGKIEIEKRITIMSRKTTSVKKAGTALSSVFTKAGKVKPHYRDYVIRTM